MSDAVKDGMASAFFATAWADMVEEEGMDVNLSGEEITNIMPEIDPSAEASAEKLYKRIEKDNGRSMERIVEEMYMREGGDEDYEFEELFGHYLAMESMGHGVSWSDDHAHHGLALPHSWDFGYWDFRRTYDNEGQPEEN